jgi:p-aminobenzoyl-glutamate transporter AbgT
MIGRRLAALVVAIAIGALLWLAFGPSPLAGLYAWSAALVAFYVLARADA